MCGVGKPCTRGCTAKVALPVQVRPEALFVLRAAEVFVTGVESGSQRERVRQ